MSKINIIKEKIKTNINSPNNQGLVQIDDFSRNDNNLYLYFRYNFLFSIVINTYFNNFFNI